SPVKIEGRQIASTFWGKAWCDNLESYRDYENRLPRGRTYVRNGSVVDLQIAPREVTAIVSGSKIYKVKVSIGNVGPARWRTLCQTRGRSATRRKPWLVTISRRCSVWTWRRVRLRLLHARPMPHRPAPERKRAKAWLRTWL